MQLQNQEKHSSTIIEMAHTESYSISAEVTDAESRG